MCVSPSSTSSPALCMDHPENVTVLVGLGVRCSSMCIFLITSHSEFISICLPCWTCWGICDLGFALWGTGGLSLSETYILLWSPGCSQRDHNPAETNHILCWEIHVSESPMWLRENASPALKVSQYYSWQNYFPIVRNTNTLHSTPNILQ